jgi:hypothetical protein
MAPSSPDANPTGIPCEFSPWDNDGMASDGVLSTAATIMVVVLLVVGVDGLVGLVVAAEAVTTDSVIGVVESIGPTAVG